MPFFSIVTPVYGCKTSLYELYFRLKKTLDTLNPDFEIIMVNDGSPDGAWETIVELTQKDHRIKGINLSRNFGQHIAITAGLEHSAGDKMIVMDCDLQDMPEEIPKLIEKFNEGNDVVFGRRKIRHDSLLKKGFSKLFYKLFDYFTGNDSDSAVSNFGIFSRQVIDDYLKFTERARLFPLLIKWMGFRIDYVDVNHAERQSGKSSYNFTRLIDMAIDGIISQSTKPLRLFIKLGFLMSVVSFVFLIFFIVRKFYLNVPMGWTSIMVTVSFIGGLLFANLGIIGLYIGKIFDETKNRPMYLIKETAGSFIKT